MRSQRKIKTGLLLLFIAGAAVSIRLSSVSMPRTEGTYATLGFAPMSATQFEAAIEDTLSVYLLVLYAAFSRPDEASTYDTLASVAHGDALEDVYLARIGASARSGLQDKAQKIHEIDLLGNDVSRRGDELSVLAAWQVVGTVNHSEHTHVRGGTFGAVITIAPVKGAWKITGFELLDVNRDAVGEIFLAPQTN